MSNLDQIKKLRSQTKAGVMACRQALSESDGDLKKAAAWLRQKGAVSAKKRVGRETKAGLVEAYIHNGGQVVGLVELNCETDFVARNEEFKKLAHELAMQVAAMNPVNARALLRQAYIREPQLKVNDLIKEVIAKIGENIVVGRIARFEVGKK